MEKYTEKYLKKYLKAIKEANTDRTRVLLIGRLYDDGFADGFDDSTRLHSR